MKTLYPSKTEKPHKTCVMCGYRKREAWGCVQCGDTDFSPTKAKEGEKEVKFTFFL